MEHYHAPITIDSLLSSIATFHTTKIIVTDPSKYLFIGSIPELMYACVSTESKIIQEYKKLPSSGPRELNSEMMRSIEEADKPAKRGKKQETKKREKGVKVSKVQTPKKQNSEKVAPSQPKKKKAKKVVRKLILSSSSDSDSEYVPSSHHPFIQPNESESESESSDDEGSVCGDTPPRSPTPEVTVRSQAPSPPPISIPISPIITSQPTSTIPIPTPIFSEATTTTTTGVQTNVSDTGVRTSAPETPVTTKPPSDRKSVV